MKTLDVFIGSDHQPVIAAAQGNRLLLVGLDGVVRRSVTFIPRGALVFADRAHPRDPGARCRVLSPRGARSDADGWGRPMGNLDRDDRIAEGEAAANNGFTALFGGAIETTIDTAVLLSGSEVVVRISLGFERNGVFLTRERE